LVFYRQEKHTDIGHRLVEAQYELTDALAYYLCSRKPDHANGHHFIIPEMADSVDSFELAKAARKKLQMVFTSLDVRSTSFLMHFLIPVPLICSRHLR